MNIFEAMEAGNGKACEAGYAYEGAFYVSRAGDVFVWGNLPSGEHPRVSDCDLKRNDWVPYPSADQKEHDRKDCPFIQIPTKPELIEMAKTILRQNEIVLHVNATLMATLSSPVSLELQNDYNKAGLK